jgi:hypothetical protein
MEPFLANPDPTTLPKPAVKWAFEPPRVTAATGPHMIILDVALGVALGG